MTVACAGQSVELELRLGREMLFSGPWELDVHVGGRLAECIGDWEEVCWVSDADVDYLELGIELSGGVCVQRQMLLAREDRFLVLADAVLGEPGSEAQARGLRYRGRLPLCPGVSLRGAAASREGFLVGRNRQALVLPLALPEWRADRRFGELAQIGAALELRRSTPHCRLYAPLWLDLDRRRHTQRVTWRRLTVAESLSAVADDVAVGYRAAVGRRQWLLYRSLAERANRTLLGHNLSGEALVARFDRNGEVEALIEIE